MIDHLLGIIAPHSCCSCGYLGSILCQQCKDDIISEPFAQCVVCLKPTSVTNLCDQCRQRTGYANVWCVGTRDTQLKALLDRYKFDGVRQAGRVAAEVFDARLPVLPGSYVVVPVPTSPKHQRVRGFDHMAIIGRQLARMRDMSFSGILTTYRSDTQHFKTRQQRQKTAAQGLGVQGAVPQHVLLVDDIYTTGSTLRACADLLRHHGAQTISVAIIARQTLDESDDLW